MKDQTKAKKSIISAKEHFGISVLESITKLQTQHDRELRHVQDALSCAITENIKLTDTMKEMLYSVPFRAVELFTGQPDELYKKALWKILQIIRKTLSGEKPEQSK